MEIIGKSWRTATGIMVQAFFAVGIMICSGVAYLIRDYFYFELAISLPVLLLLSYYWLLPESPRWLITEGRDAEAEKVIQVIAKWNRTTFKPLAEYRKQTMDFINGDANENTATKVATRKYSFFDLFRTTHIRIITLNLGFTWFVTSMVYYGLSLIGSQLAGDIYLNFFLTGAVELPGYFIILPLLKKVGRRWSLCGCLLLGGSMCLACIPIPENLGIFKTALAMVGKVGISASFAVLYVFTAELYPTVIRTIGVGCGSIAARVGSLLSPFIADMGKMWKPLPFVIFGSLSIIAALLSFMFPETLNRKLPETIEDARNRRIGSGVGTSRTDRRTVEQDFKQELPMI